MGENGIRQVAIWGKLAFYKLLLGYFSMRQVSISLFVLGYIVLTPALIQSTNKSLL